MARFLHCIQKGETDVLPTVLFRDAIVVEGHSYAARIDYWRFAGLVGGFGRPIRVQI